MVSVTQRKRASRPLLNPEPLASIPLRRALGILREGGALKEKIIRKEITGIGAFERERLSLLQSILLEMEREHPLSSLKMRKRISDYLGPAFVGEGKLTYEKGVQAAINIHTKLEKVKKGSPEEAQGMRKAITAYTLDFYLSLRNSQLLKVHPKTALNMASMVHYHDPFLLPSMLARYRNLGRNTMETKISRLRSPEGYLARLDKSLPVFAKKYPGMQKSSIERILRVHAEDKWEETMERASSEISRLTALFPELRSSIEREVSQNIGEAGKRLRERTSGAANQPSEMATPVSDNRAIFVMLRLIPRRRDDLGQAFRDYMSHYGFKAETDAFKKILAEFEKLRPNKYLKKMQDDLIVEYIIRHAERAEEKLEAKRFR